MIYEELLFGPGAGPKGAVSFNCVLVLAGSGDPPATYATILNLGADTTGTAAAFKLNLAEVYQALLVTAADPDGGASVISPDFQLN
jgi:hypothetical protein